MFYWINQNVKSQHGGGGKLTKYYGQKQFRPVRLKTCSNHSVLDETVPRVAYKSA